MAVVPQVSETKAEIKAAPAIKEKLSKLGLVTSADLVFHLPIRYEDETALSEIVEASLTSTTS